MATDLLPLNGFPEVAAEQVGVKAAILGRLLAAGFPAPSGLCVTTAAFRTALMPYAQAVRAVLHGAIVRDPTEAHAAARQIQALLAGLALPAALRQELQQALPTLGGGLLAVRSSATLEDLPDASFAGQYQTLLGVTDASQVEAAILSCWRSFFHPHALAARAAYAATGHAPDEDPALALLIQPLLDAECSGVCFSVDPVHKRPGALLIVATWGLGTGVVDGTIPADTARLRRTGLEVEAVEVAAKHECIRPDPAGGLRRVAGPEGQQQIACLPEPWLQQIAQFGLALEQFLGQPQDVEWAIANGQIWILQSRPITALPPDVVQAARFPVEWADEPERRALWHLANISSRPSALLLPAEIDFVKTRFEGGDAAVVHGGGDKTFWRKYANGIG